MSRSGAATHVRGSAATIAIPPAMPQVEWHQAVGPEATDAELVAYAEQIARDFKDRYPYSPGSYESTMEHELARLRRDLAGVHDPSLVPSHERSEPLRYPTRRGLEALLAMEAGVPLRDFQQENADLSWTELIDGVQDPEVQEAREIDRDLRHALEHARTSAAFAAARADDPQLASRASLREGRLAEARARLAPLIKRRDLGARTGRPEDYSRAEMRRLLGFREHDCEHLSDDELRGMCLSGHLIPRFATSPSHVELALRAVSGHEYEMEKSFHKAMREPYSRLVRREGREEFGTVDDGKRPTEDVVRDIGEINPIVAALGKSAYGNRSRQLYRDARRNKVSVDLPPAVDNRSRFPKLPMQTAIELHFHQPFSTFLDRFGVDRRPQRISGEMPKGTRGALGLYEYSTNTIHLHSSLSKLVDDARAGQATPREVERATSTLAHEMFHAMSGTDAGNDRAGMKNPKTAEHTVDEGLTETMGRLHAPRLAQDMGLWDSETQGSLREHAETGSYPEEVQTILTLGQALYGDSSRRAEAGFTQPEHVDPQVIDALQQLHLSRGVEGVIHELRDRVALRSGRDPQSAEKGLRKLLRECKSSRYTHRRKRVRQTDSVFEEYVYLDPESLTDKLDTMIKDLLT